MAFNKLTTLHKHTTRTTSGVKDFALIGLDNLYYGTNHARGRVELTAFLSLFSCKFAKEVFVHTAKHITGFLACKVQIVLKDVYHITQNDVCRLRDGHSFSGVCLSAACCFLQRFHCRINDNTYFSCKCGLYNLIPTGIDRHEKDVVANVFVRVFLKTVTFCHKFIVLDLEAVVDVL